MNLELASSYTTIDSGAAMRGESVDDLRRCSQGTQGRPKLAQRYFKSYVKIIGRKWLKIFPGSPN